MRILYKLSLFLSQFKNAITLIMVVTAIFSLLVNEVIDAVAIVFIILIDVIMGTVQERKAEKTVIYLCTKCSVFPEFI